MGGLWKKLIPDKTPLADDVNIEYLAKAYIFSGGQILNVVKNAAIAATIREGESKKVFQDDLIKYAEIEKQSAFENDKIIVGFSQVK